jgi:hypothetical protein
MQWRESHRFHMYTSDVIGAKQNKNCEWPRHKLKKPGSVGFGASISLYFVHIFICLKLDKPNRLKNNCKILVIVALILDLNYSRQEDTRCAYFFLVVCRRTRAQCCPQRNQYKQQALNKQCILVQFRWLLRVALRSQKRVVPYKERQPKIKQNWGHF